MVATGVVVDEAPRKKKRVAALQVAATRAAERKKRRAAVQAAAAPSAAAAVDADGDGYHYRKIKKIGTGAYGVVYRGEDVRTGEAVAMKCLLPDGGGDDAFGREVDALEACRGLPFVVQLRGTCRSRRGEAFIVTEYVGTGSTLWDDAGGKRHPEAEVRRLTRQLLAGAAGMHRAGLMHRDMKPDNVLVDDLGGLKICDLGMSCRTSEPPPYSYDVAAMRYRAPELLLGSTHYDGRVDSWAIGCIMAELLAGEHLFEKGTDEDDQLDAVMELLGTDDICSWRCFNRPLPAWCRPESSRLRERFPSPEAAARTGLPALSEAGFEVLERLLRCNPDLRMTPARALRHRWFLEEQQ